MSRYRIAAAGLLTLAAAACADAPNAPEARPAEIAPRQSVSDAVVSGEVLVKMKPGFSLSDLDGGDARISFTRALVSASRTS
ncbi:MAG TPA: hypothetical protein VGB66_19800, partial [Longimicrobium sp.]